MLLACVHKEQTVQIFLASALLLIFTGCGRAPKENQAAQSFDNATAQQVPDNQPDDATATPEEAADAAPPMPETQRMPAPVATALAPMHAPTGVQVSKQFNGRGVQRRTVSGGIG